MLGLRSALTQMDGRTDRDTEEAGQCKRISLVVLKFRQLFELRRAGLDQLIQGLLHSAQVAELFPQGARLLSSPGASLKHVANPTERQTHLL